jgi:hypothetical protein
LERLIIYYNSGPKNWHHQFGEAFHPTIQRFHQNWFHTGTNVICAHDKILEHSIAPNLWRIQFAAGYLALGHQPKEMCGRILRSNLSSPHSPCVPCL